MMRKGLRAGGLGLAMVALAAPAYADAGAPMLFVTLPGMVVGLVPIIFIEAFVLMKLLGIGFRDSAKASVAANIASTLVGVPLTWVFLVALQILTGGGLAHGMVSPLQKFLAVTWQAPWLIPYESELYWMMPVATSVLLVPFFFASWLLEAWIVRMAFREREKKVISRSVFLANLASYALLLFVSLGWLVQSIMGRK